MEEDTFTHLALGADRGGVAAAATSANKIPESPFENSGKRAAFLTRAPHGD